MNNEEELDLRYQLLMLVSHVEDFLKEIPNYDTHNEGVYSIIDDDIEPMQKRLETIRKIQSNHL